MSVRTIHFRRITPHARIIVRPLCDRANVRCSDSNSSAEPSAVTCKPCLRRMADAAAFAKQGAAIREQISQESA